MRRVVLPRRSADPDHIRLDGARTGGNWEKVGEFRHHGSVWNVYADTHYEPLMIAYSAAEVGKDPFIEEDTSRGRSLTLTPELRMRQRSRHKYMYIYVWPAASAGSFGSTSSFVRTAPALQDAMRMSDPLAGFDWTKLYNRYDTKCSRFGPHSEHLKEVLPAPATDRSLYYHLVQAASTSISGPRSGLDVGWYKALLYWKLYSQRYEKIAGWLPNDESSRRRNTEQLRFLLAKMPATIPQQLPAITSLLNIIDTYGLPGMKTATALPVRSTFLHILYPTVVPIFDSMVLRAVGVTREGANQSIDVFCEYLPHAWALARKHTQRLTGFKETPVRLTDMALWIVRDSE